MIGKVSLLDVVERDQMEATLIMSESVLDVGSSVILASVAGTVLTDGAEIARIFLLLQLEHAILGES